MSEAARAKFHANVEQHARAKLARSNSYADARTTLAKEQAERVRQIRLEAQGKLIDADEVRRLLVTAASTFSVRLRGVEKRLRSVHPGLSPKIYAFIRDEHESALKLMSEEILKTGRDD